MQAEAAGIKFQRATVTQNLIYVHSPKCRMWTYPLVAGLFVSKDLLESIDVVVDEGEPAGCGRIHRNFVSIDQIVLPKRLYSQQTKQTQDKGQRFDRRSSTGNCF